MTDDAAPSARRLIAIAFAIRWTEDEDDQEELADLFEECGAAAHAALENAERERDEWKQQAEDAQGAVQVYCDEFNRMEAERNATLKGDEHE